MPFSGGMSRPRMVQNSKVREDVRWRETESEMERQKDRRRTEPTNEPKQPAETKACKTPSMSYKIKRSMREKEKAANRAARESKKERQGEAVNSLPWLS